MAKDGGIRGITSPWMAKDFGITLTPPWMAKDGGIGRITSPRMAKDFGITPTPPWMAKNGRTSGMNLD